MSQCEKLKDIHKLYSLNLEREIENVRNDSRNTKIILYTNFQGLYWGPSLYKAKPNIEALSENCNIYEEK